MTQFRHRRQEVNTVAAGRAPGGIGDAVPSRWPGCQVPTGRRCDAALEADLHSPLGHHAPVECWHDSMCRFTGVGVVRCRAPVDRALPDEWSSVLSARCRSRLGSHNAACDEPSPPSSDSSDRASRTIGQRCRAARVCGKGTRHRIMGCCANRRREALIRYDYGSESCCCRRSRRTGRRRSADR